MREAFMASLCWYGVHGGGLYADDNGLVYRAQKLTLPEELKKIAIAYSDIKSVSRCRFFVFPAVKIMLGSGRGYKFIVFGRRRLLKVLTDKKIETI